MEEFNYTFNNGLQFKCTLGEDGYTVGLVGGNLEEPLMGTFTDFEELLYALAPVVQDNVQDAFEFGLFSGAFYMNFADSTSLSNDEVTEILLK